MGRSTIEWTESTWNPVTGCTKISPGCMNCYAERLAKRLQAMGQQSYENGFRVSIHEHLLPLPLTWRKPQRIFVNSMSDIFHEDVPDEFVVRLFETMRQASWHTFQLLTKRTERMGSLHGMIHWPTNVWMGASVEARGYLWRLDHLRRSPADIKFASFEPLLESLGKIDLSFLDWVIVGGESGPGARPIETAWVTEIRDQCRESGVPFFFKQWGGTNKRRTGRLLDGRTWDEMPRISRSS